MERLGDLFFELSNDDRLNILHRLDEKSMKLTNLSRDIGFTTQECSRHLSRLVEAKLIGKGSEGKYRLTSYGELTLRLQRGYKFTSRHRDYFNSHSLTCLPLEFIGRLGELDNSVYVDDVMVIFKNIENMMQDAEEYIWRLTDRFLMIFLPHILSATGRGVEYRLIFPMNIAFPPDVNQTAQLREARDKGLFTAKRMEKGCVFLTMSEKEVTAVSFPTLDGRFDYWGFTSTDEQVHSWCKNLYQYYWEKSTPALYRNW